MFMARWWARWGRAHSGPGEVHSFSEAVVLECQEGAEGSLGANTGLWMVCRAPCIPSQAPSFCACPTGTLDSAHERWHGTVCFKSALLLSCLQLCKLPSYLILESRHPRSATEARVRCTGGSSIFILWHLKKNPLPFFFLRCWVRFSTQGRDRIRQNINSQLLF